MLSVKGIFNNKTIELLEEVPYQKEVKVIVTFLDDKLLFPQPEKLEQYSSVECSKANNKEIDDTGKYEKLKQDLERVLMRENYLRHQVAKGATNEELQKLIADMDKIDNEFKTVPEDKRLKEARRYADQKLKEWCERHDVAYNPEDDLIVSDFINDAIQKVREENKRIRKKSE